MAEKIPTIFGFREFVEAGGLMSYGPNFADLFRRAADFTDKILRGAKPADMPVEQATTSSLEALKAYSLGVKTWNMKGDTAALPLFKRAVELDPQFAIAYARLGSAYRNFACAMPVKVRSAV